MERNRRSPEFWVRIYLGLALFSLAGTWFSTQFELDALWLERFFSLALILSGALAVFFALPERRRAIAAIAVFSVGAVSEIVGMFTGIPFGKYAYTGAWWPGIPMGAGHEFPLILPFAWMMIAAGSVLWLRTWLTPIPAVLCGAVLATLVDIVMEPVMVGPLGYWVWLDPVWPIGGSLPGGVPFMNAVGWFSTTVVAGWLLFALGSPRIGERWPNTRPLGWIVLGHAVFTILIGYLIGF